MNYGKKHDLPFGIMDVAGLLRLNIRRRAPGQVYVDCPICGDRRGKMNLNTAKDLWRCNYCGEGGGMLSLYAKVYGVSNSDAYREICDALAVNGFSPDYTVPEKTTPAEAEQSDAASVQEVHQTLSMLLSMLTLIPAHRVHLQSVRGLSDDEITRFGFKSTPPPFLCRSLTNRLVKAGCRVQGVPGFYVDDNGCWTVKFHQRTSGIIIPIFGVDGLIRGAQIRLDHPLKDKDDPPEKTGVKYLTLSSTGKRMPVHKIAQAGVARTFQNIRLFSDLTCYENVKTSCQKNVHYGFLDGILRTSRCRSEEARLDNECKEYLREVGLWEQANVLARNLPYGMQRRLEIARAMVTFPKLLLLDEPAAGMNEEESRQLTEIIKELRDKHDVTIIIIDHHMDVIMDVCDKITVINFGTQIATGAPESIQSNPDVIAAYLGENES